MQFSNFTRAETGNIIIFDTKQPLQGVSNIKYYKDDSSGSFQKKEFRWSFNGDYWANWESLNQGNLSGISIGSNPLLFLELRYTSAGGTVNTFTLNYDGAAQSTTPSTTCPPDSNYVQKDKTVQDPYEASCHPSGLVDADTLCGKSCDYYLWRPNHKGEQPISSVTDLQRILNELTYLINNAAVTGAQNVDGDGIGVYHSRDDRTLYFKKLVEGNKIFITETPAGQVTIAVDDASINELFEELGALDGVNVGGSDPSTCGLVFKQRIDEDFQFRAITAGNANVRIKTIGDQVRISLDASASGAPVWSDPDQISADVGGLVSGDIVNIGDNSIEILEDILYEYFPPQIDFNLDPASGYYEKWNPFVLSDVSVYGSFNNDDFVKVKTTDVSAYATLLGGFGHTSYSDVSSGDFSFNDGGFNSNWDDIVYSVKVYHKVNLTQMAPAEASAAINFVPPYIWGVTTDDYTINDPDASLAALLDNFYNVNQKIIETKQTNEVIFDASTIFKAKFVYAYPAAYGELSSIFDVKNDFNVTTSFDFKDISYQYQSSPILPYKIYIKNHWIDVSTFKLIFNI